LPGPPPFAGGANQSSDEEHTMDPKSMSTLGATSLLALTLGLAGCGEGEQGAQPGERAPAAEVAPGAAPDAAPDAANDAIAEPPPPATSDAEPVAPPSSLDSIEAHARAAAKELQAAGTEAAAAAAAATRAFSETASERAAELSAALEEQGSALAGQASARAEELMTRVRGHLEDNDLGSANDALQKLKDLQHELPEELRTQIQQLREKMNDMIDDQTAG
jgi:uncharacterized phage infection (PIP) family protein YhgE